MTPITTAVDRVVKHEITASFDVALCNLILEMQQDNYDCCAPSPDVEKLDAKIIGGSLCRRCKGELYYTPFTKRNAQGEWAIYRPFTVCKQCGQAREF